MPSPLETNASQQLLIALGDPAGIGMEVTLKTEEAESTKRNGDARGDALPPIIGPYLHRYHPETTAVHLKAYQGPFVTPFPSLCK